MSEPITQNDANRQNATLKNKPLNEANTSLAKLMKLKQQREIIEARIQAAEARLKTTQRKQDTRRKILVGSYYLDKAQKENTLEHLKLQLCGYLTRESDRKLFGLSQKTKNLMHEEHEKILPASLENTEMNEDSESSEVA